MQAMAELVAENARSGNPAHTPQELAVALLQGGTPREAVETRLPGLVSTLFGRSGGSAGATDTAGWLVPKVKHRSGFSDLLCCTRGTEHFAVMRTTISTGLPRLPCCR